MKKYQDAIIFYKYLKDTSKTVFENNTYHKGLELAKVTFITSFSNEINDLLPKKNEKCDIKKCEKILNKYEKLFREFQYDNLLRTKISEIKKRYYSIALEKIIEEKIQKNVEYSNEMNKYKALIDTENIKENRLEEFMQKNISNSNNNEYEKNSQEFLNINDKKNSQNNEFKDISLETINKYLELIKIINEAPLSEKIEKDIISQVINYNKESHKSHDNIECWILTNSYNIKNNNEFRGNVFSLFNSLNFLLYSNSN